MKNTNKHFKIKEKNFFNKKEIVAGVVLFSLLSFVSSDTLSVDNDESPVTPVTTNQTYDKEVENQKETNNEIGCNEKYNYYSSKYLESLKNMDENSFDKNFRTIYDLNEYTINGQTYESRLIYITKYEDGSVHLIKVDEQEDVDLFDKTKIESKQTGFCKFKNSSIYYELYKQGIIKDGEVPSEVKNLISSWDGKKSTATPSLQAEEEASEEYKKKYGR